VEWDDGADRELDDVVGVQRDTAGVAGEANAVDQGGDSAVGGANLVAVEWLAPDVEELAQGVRTLDRGFDVDHAGPVVGV
jgi:hypothetical protein